MLRNLSARNGVVAVVLVLLVGIAGVACSAALQEKPAPAQQVKLEGTYTCTGRNPDGNPYQGMVRIAKQGDAYYLTWQLGPAGQERHEGIGLVTGQMLSVSWRVGPEGGIVVYAIKRAGDSVRLEGKWTAFGANGQVLEETLARR